MVGVTEAPPSASGGRVAEQLRRAVAEGDVECLTRLVGLGADVDQVDEAGFTPLQRAACEGKVDMVKQLIKCGANINRQDEQHGNSALHEACWKGFSDTASALLRARSDVHLRNLGGFAALHLACQNGHNQSCRVVLLAGCKPDIKNNYGDTAIHTAARYGHAGVTRILLSARASVTHVNKNGDTGLHIAAAMGRRKLTKMLLEAGALQGTKNKQDETAMDIASRKELTQIVAILRSPPPVVPIEERLRQEQQQQQQREPDEATKGRTTKKDSRRRDKNDSGTSSKESGSRPKEKKKLKSDFSSVDPRTRASRLSVWGVDWSPYGCHFDPPSGKMKVSPHKAKDVPTATTANELGNGEQFFVDLAGNIQKGPVGVEASCYCAPLFQTVQHKLECDKIDLMDHIDAAHGKLGARISSLELHTRGHIKRLGDTVQQKIALERDECCKRSDTIKLSQVKTVASKVDHMKSWVEQRLALHHPDSPSSIRGKTFIGKRYSFRNNGYPLVRSRSEEAISEIVKDEELEEPLYKGLRVLDYPTSMYNIPQQVETNSCSNERFNKKCLKVNQSSDDTTLSDLPYKDHSANLPNLTQVSEPEESSTNDCSTQKSVTFSDIAITKSEFYDRCNDQSSSFNKSRLRKPLPPDIAPQVDFLRDAYVPPDLNHAVNNLHVYENNKHFSQENVDRLCHPNMNGNGFPPQQFLPHLSNNGDNFYPSYSNSNPYVYNIREQSTLPQNGHYRDERMPSYPDHYYLPPHVPKDQSYCVSVDQPYPNHDGPMYLDMDRYRIQAAVKKLYNGYLTDCHVDLSRSGKGVMETSTEHDSHNDSGYSTRLCSTSQGPSPALSVVPPPQFLQANCEKNSHNALLLEQHAMQFAIPPPYHTFRDSPCRNGENGMALSLPPRNGYNAVFPPSHTLAPGRITISDSAEAVLQKSCNGINNKRDVDLSELIGESSLV